MQNVILILAQDFVTVSCRKIIISSQYLLNEILSPDPELSMFMYPLRMHFQ